MPLTREAGGAQGKIIMKYTHKTIDGATYYSKQKPDSQLKDFALVIGTIYLGVQVYLLAFYSVTVM